MTQTAPKKKQIGSIYTVKAPQKKQQKRVKQKSSKIRAVSQCRAQSVGKIVTRAYSQKKKQNEAHGVQMQEFGNLQSGKRKNGWHEDGSHRGYGMQSLYETLNTVKRGEQPKRNILLHISDINFMNTQLENYITDIKKKYLESCLLNTLSRQNIFLGKDKKIVRQQNSNKQLTGKRYKIGIDQSKQQNRRYRKQHIDKLEEVYRKNLVVYQNNREFVKDIFKNQNMR